MREIKFRAWDSENEIMIAEADLPYLICQNVNTVPEDTIRESYIFLQYTGLVDKSGVEIYEGDIVSGVLYKDRSEHIGRILFDLNGYMISTIEKSMPLDLTELLTVIGNIYENPELLGGEE